MKRFLQNWLIPILIVLMLVGAVCVFLPFAKRQEQKARLALDALVENAFARMESMQDAGAPGVEAAQENLTDQARAVSRLLAHDDALLASDALSAMCAQLGFAQIDVCGMEGILIASSDASRVELAIGEDPAYAWTKRVLDNPQETASITDADTVGLLHACAAREDAEGFVLVSKQDAYAASLMSQADAGSVTADMAYGDDLLFETHAGEPDGYFTAEGNLCLRKTRNGVSLIAARPLHEVHLGRSVALLVFAACAVGALICALVYYVLHLQAPGEVDEEEERRLPPGAQDEAPSEQPDEAKQPITHARADRRRKRTAGAVEAEQPPAPRRPRRPGKRAFAEETAEDAAETAASHAQKADADDDGAFDKIFD